MPSFDVVSKVAMNEVDNALLQSQKEVAQRFDFKDTETTLEKTEEGIVLKSNSEGRLEAAYKVLQEKLVKRHVPLNAFEADPPKPAGGSMWRQIVKFKEGVAGEKAKEIVKFIKDSKMKVQAAIMGDQIRITGKKKDDLQETIQSLRAKDFGITLQYTNFRD